MNGDALWIASIGASVLVGVAGGAAVRRLPPAGPGFCGICGYDRGGLLSTVDCPECGSAWDAKPPEATEGELYVRWVRMALTIVLGVISLIGLPVLVIGALGAAIHAVAWLVGGAVWGRRALAWHWRAKLELVTLALPALAWVPMGIVDGRGKSLANMAVEPMLALAITAPFALACMTAARLHRRWAGWVLCVQLVASIAVPWAVYILTRPMPE